MTDWIKFRKEVKISNEKIMNWFSVVPMSDDEDAVLHIDKGLNLILQECTRLISISEDCISDNDKDNMARLMNAIIDRKNPENGFTYAELIFCLLPEGKGINYHQLIRSISDEEFDSYTDEIDNLLGAIRILGIFKTLYETKKKKANDFHFSVVPAVTTIGVKKIKSLDSAVSLDGDIHEDDETEVIFNAAKTKPKTFVIEEIKKHGIVHGNWNK